MSKNKSTATNVKVERAATARTKRIVAKTKMQTKVQTAAANKSSKHDQILGLLRRKPGATIEELQKVSGWQAHSVRGFMSGTVKKKLGLKLQSTKPKDGERRYSIAAN